MSSNVTVRMTEEQEQMVFVEWLRINHIPHFHCPNEVGGQTKSLRMRAIKMKRMGVSKGVPDLFIFIPVYGIDHHIDAYQAVVIEMKRKKGARASIEQKEWLKIIESSGVPCAICKGAEEAINFIEGIRSEINDN